MAKKEKSYFRGGKFPFGKRRTRRTRIITRGLLISVFSLFLSAVLLAVLYGNAEVLIGEGTIVEPINFDIFIFIIILGSGLVSIITTCIITEIQRNG